MAKSKLAKIVDSVLPFHTQVLNPAQKVRIVLQQRFEFYIPESHRHVSLGNFYEYMTQGLWGGKLQNHLLLKNGKSEEKKRNRNSLHKFTKPDLIHHIEKQIGESKAIRSGQSVNLTDEQMARYKLLQLQKQDAHIYFAIYRHGFPRIKSFKGTEEELFERLSKATYHYIVLPLSIIMQLHETENSGLVYRYDGERFDRCTCVRSQILNRFLTEPALVIGELGLKFSDFRTERFISSKRFKLGGYDIEPFPILRVYDMNHEVWIKDFVEKIRDDDGLSGLIDEYYQEYPEEYDPRQDGCSDADEIDKELGSEGEEDFDEEEIPF